MNASLTNLFGYDDWANREALAALRAAPALSARAMQLMGHIVSAQRLWWRRIHGEPPDMPVWPELSLQECGAHLEQLQSMWGGFLDNLTPALAVKTISYTNSMGEEWQNAVEDILRHVLLHGSYHRGQIATHLRLAGLTPAYTDYIHAVRRGLLE